MKLFSARSTRPFPVLVARARSNHAPRGVPVPKLVPWYEPEDV